MNNKVFVVTISELLPVHGHDFHVEVFSDEKKTVKWIDGEIDRLVAEYKLDREHDVDDWFVKVDGCTHTFQYDIEEMQVK